MQTIDVLGNGGSCGLWQKSHVIWKQETWPAIPVFEVMSKAFASLNLGFFLCKMGRIISLYFTRLLRGANEILCERYWEISHSAQADGISIQRPKKVDMSPQRSPSIRHCFGFRPERPVKWEGDCSPSELLLGQISTNVAT